MAFGQQSGPPATAKQVKELLGLLQDAGHLDFRDARGPLGFTQRQAGGKFSRDEADAFIEQLQAEADGTSGVADPTDAPTPTKVPAARRSAADKLLESISTERLAAELQARGWIVVEP